MVVTSEKAVEERLLAPATPPEGLQEQGENVDDEQPGRENQGDEVAEEES